jgi:hypothetical protein
MGPSERTRWALLSIWSPGRREKGAAVEDLSYPSCTRELYESEILGETLFLALVQEAKSARDRYHLGTLLQLESETKARLRPLLYKHGVSLGEVADASLVELAIAAYRDMAWRDFAGLNVPVVEDFLARFEAIVEVGDEADREILESMVRHEAAILRWATMERDGIVNGSLNDVIAQLNYPLPVAS